jgi:hypothetical protein
VHKENEKVTNAVSENAVRRWSRELSLGVIEIVVRKDTLEWGGGVIKEQE